MVGQETIRTARRVSLASAFGLAATLAAPAFAQSEQSAAPDANTDCPALSIGEDTLRSRTDPLPLPDDWKGFAGSSMNWIAVRTELGTVHCVKTAWFDATKDYERLTDRFLGFDWGGYEAWGYMLIDTSEAGQSMDVGAKPMFSPNGFRFATVQFSDAGWGGFEGFAVWRVYEGGMTPEHVDTRLPYMADWRLDGWEGDDCIRLSAIPHDRIEDWEKLSEYARDSYVSGSATGWKLTPGSTCPTY